MLSRCYGSTPCALVRGSFLFGTHPLLCRFFSFSCGHLLAAISPQTCMTLHCTLFSSLGVLFACSSFMSTSLSLARVIRSLVHHDHLCSYRLDFTGPRCTCPTLFFCTTESYSAFLSLCVPRSSYEARSQMPSGNLAVECRHKYPRLVASSCRDLRRHLSCQLYCTFSSHHIPHLRLHPRRLAALYWLIPACHLHRRQQRSTYMN